MVMQQDSIQNKFILVFLITTFFILSYSEGVKTMQINRNNKVYFYLVKDSLKPTDLSKVPIDKITLEKAPLFSSDDILKYNADIHSFMLTNEAYEKVINLKIPVDGKAFVVTIDNRPIYLGAFWTIFSSIPYDGIIIVQPIHKENQELKIQLGYPKEEFFKGQQDFRNNPDILEILSQKSRQ